MDKEPEISRLIDRLRELEDRVTELEQSSPDVKDDAIGFDVDVQDDFDEDDSEYMRSLARSYLRSAPARYPSLWSTSFTMGYIDGCSRIINGN